MKREEFKNLLNKGALFLDGATGTELQKEGMPVGVCPEQWIIEHEEIMKKLQKRYVEAGSNIVYAPTFTANRIKLSEYGLEDKVTEMNRKLVSISKEAVENQAYVAADISMTGQQLYPLGDLMFEDLVEVYKEQIRAVAEAGVDLVVIETMMSLSECRAALIACKETCDLPVMVTLTFENTGATLYGTNPTTAVTVLQNLGADAVGINCSTGPDQMLSLVEQMYQAAFVPIIVKPNAGLPKMVDGKTVYDMQPKEFGEEVKKLALAGARIFGGCCGTTPEHIASVVQCLQEVELPEIKTEHKRILTSERMSVEIQLDGEFLVIGERINPTGKKKLQAELKEGSLNLVCDMARQQEKSGAKILDINMGMNGIDEKKMMLSAIYEVSSVVDLPLCIDSSHVDIMEAALRIYPGRALINSISLEKEKFEQLLPIAKKYGAMFILLPLSDEGLPENKEEKHKIIDTIVTEALAQGMCIEDIVVDGLVATVGANANAAVECFETIEYCRDKSLATVCGLSNISFGLPERSFVNTAFLTVAIAKGLTMAIANPAQEALMNAAFATDLLMNKKGADLRYIYRMNERKERMETQTVQTDSTSGLSVQKTQEELVFECVVGGEKGKILAETKVLLSQGMEPEVIISDVLIPAINRVGELFEAQKYFLPQLISSAATMQKAIEYLEPMIQRTQTDDEQVTIIMATVEGDIHDIGKNLVVLMLKNYGYRVIDLGKDVAASVIVDCAMKEHAAIIGLSALMTTTMMRMKDVVELVKEKGCTSKVIIGGAAITESFAEEIGADGYSSDAADCVKLVKRLLEE